MPEEKKGALKRQLTDLQGQMQQMERRMAATEEKVDTVVQCTRWVIEGGVHLETAYADAE